MLLTNVPNSIVKVLIQLKSSHALSDESLIKLKPTMVINRLKHSETESMGDIMLHMMEDDPTIEWVAYYGPLTDAEKTVHVRKRSSKKKRQKKKAKVTKKGKHPSHSSYTARG